MLYLKPTLALLTLSASYGLPFAFAQEAQTGNDIIIAFNGLSDTYQSLAVLFPFLLGRLSKALTLP